MPKFIVSFECVEYYEKEYEAASMDEAQEMYEGDENLFDATPLGTTTELVDIVEA
jgi:hypothetical protein